MALSHLPSIAFKTFGCRLNQAESEGWRNALSADGYPLAEIETADILCVHSCAVTEPAVKEVVKFLRTARKHNPLQRIILSGCATDLVKDIEIDVRIPHAQKPQWLHYVRNFLMDTKCERKNAPTLCEHHRTRVSLIIQDGCDQFCNYCIVPYMRGAPMSIPCSTLLRQAEERFASGYREIVLTGCHLALYNDPESGADFVELLRRLCAVRGEGRFRIGSIEPCIVNDKALIRLIATSGGRICPFLHFPMQSADDHVLALMGRRYRQADLRDLMDTVCAELPRCGVSADWIAGHPGESHEAAQVTADFIAAYPFTGAHVFPYSKRAGTPAATFPNQVPQTEILSRAKWLRQVAKTQTLRQLNLQIGRPLEVIPEQRHDTVRYGWSAERFKCQLPASYPRGAIVTVTPTALEGETLIVNK